METDKLSITIDASASGTLTRILHPEGDTVPVTEPIAAIGEASDEAPAPNQSPAAPSAAFAAQEKATPPSGTGTHPAPPAAPVAAAPAAAAPAAKAPSSAVTPAAASVTAATPMAAV